MSDKPNNTIRLKGRIFLDFKIKTVTGLHIGGAFEGVEIGGVDKTVIRNPKTNRPYIPGSSLRGKMRSLVEKYNGKTLNQDIGGARIHSCDDPEEYKTCEVCRVFGLPGEREFGTPARLVVRDLQLSDTSAGDLDNANTDLPYTEIKVEVAIDRVTSQANPRQLERVPADVIFDGGQMVFSIYEGEFEYGSDPKKPKEKGAMDPLADLSQFETVLSGLSLLEDDYLGGAGARGSGRIAFTNLRLGFKSAKSGSDAYPTEPEWLGSTHEKLADLRTDWKRVKLDLEKRVK